MKSENLSSKKITPMQAWRREHLRQNWMLSMIMFCVYFIVMIVPWITNYHSFEMVGYLAEDTLTGEHFGIQFLNLIFGVAVSSALTGQLHSSDSVTAIHSMPFTRKELTINTMLTGAVLILIPMIILGALMLPFAGAQVSDISLTENYANASTVFTIPHILAWIFENTIIILFVLAISNLAAVVTGNKVIHVLVSLFFNIMMPVTMLVGIDIGETYIPGMGVRSVADMHLDFWHPMFYVMVQQAGEYPSGKNLLVVLLYLVVACILTLITVKIYERAKLERVGGSVLFSIVGDVISIVLTFIAAGCTGIVAAEMVGYSSTASGHHGRFMVVFLLSSAVYYIICRMIADSSLRIFNRKNFKKFAIYLVIAIIFSAFAVFDITGQHKKIPNVEDIQSVTIDDVDNFRSKQVSLTDAESIEAATNVQRELIDTIGVTIDSEEISHSFSISYELKNGKTMYRTYQVGYTKAFDAAHEAMEALSNTEEFQNEMNVDRSKFYSVEYTNYGEYEGTDEAGTIASKDYDGLVEAINQDLEEMSFKEIFYPRTEDSVHYKLNFLTKNDAIYMQIDVNSYMKHTQKFLTEHDYL